MIGVFLPLFRFDGKRQRRARNSFCRVMALSDVLHDIAMTRDAIVPSQDTSGAKHFPTLLGIAFHILVTMRAIDKDQINSLGVWTFVKGRGVKAEESDTIEQIAGNEDTIPPSATLRASWVVETPL